MAHRKVVPNTAIAYLRTSSVSQKLSLDAQRKVISDWAEAAGVTVLGCYEDRGRSGSINPKRRAALMLAIRAVETSRAAILVVAAEDRLSRRVDDFGWIASELELLHARVVDASEPEKDWTRRMFQRIQAQVYLDSVKLNTSVALNAKKSRGEKIGGAAPYGFRVVMDDGIKKLEPCPVEHPVLLRMIELRRSGLGGRKIASILEREGISPRGSKWDPSAITRITGRHIETT